MRMFKHARERMGYTQMQFAEMLGVSQQAISKYENGTREPSYSTLALMAKLCHTTTDYLLLDEQTDNGTSYLHEDASISLPAQTLQRVEELIQERSLELETLSNDLHKSPDDLKLFLEYGDITQFSLLLALADYFEVSLDYLLCRSDVRSILATPEEEKLVHIFRKLNPDNQDIVTGEIQKELRTQQEKEERG